eukprot:scaffold1561_cov404-Prasinococcus_capsulatus_cf.AAC.8
MALAQWPQFLLDTRRYPAMVSKELGLARTHDRLRRTHSAATVEKTSVPPAGPQAYVSEASSMPPMPAVRTFNNLVERFALK